MANKIPIFAIVLLFSVSYINSAPEGILTSIVNGVGDAINYGADTIVEDLDLGSGEAGDIARAVKDVIKYVVNGTKNSLVDAGHAVNNIANGTAVHIDKVLDEDPVSAIATGLGDAIGQITDGAGNVAQEISDGIQNVVNALTDYFEVSSSISMKDDQINM
ncbi:hypothetical protein CDAR_222781 [Caerostris darwini]|uniref:Uncharacterized protein n=1 Tax=Caerostris darwini TaxID=1538125 RepID=A0AAV4NF49_9ARAC|nr:hypothetical protein CDAR_222781 [Caerostris darwini]